LGEHLVLPKQCPPVGQCLTAFANIVVQKNASTKIESEWSKKATYCRGNFYFYSTTLLLHNISKNVFNINIFFDRVLHLSIKFSYLILNTLSVKIYIL